MEPTIDSLYGRFARGVNFVVAPTTLIIIVLRKIWCDTDAGNRTDLFATSAFGAIGVDHRWGDSKARSFGQVIIVTVWTHGAAFSFALPYATDVLLCWQSLWG